MFTETLSHAVSRVWTFGVDDLRERSWLREERESMDKKESAEKAIRDIRRRISGDDTER